MGEAAEPFLLLRTNERRGGVFGTTAARERRFKQARAHFNSTSVCAAELGPG